MSRSASRNRCTFACRAVCTQRVSRSSPVRTERTATAGRPATVRTDPPRPRTVSCVLQPRCDIGHLYSGPRPRVWSTRVRDIRGGATTSGEVIWLRGGSHAGPNRMRLKDRTRGGPGRGVWGAQGAPSSKAAPFGCLSGLPTVSVIPTHTHTHTRVKRRPSDGRWSSHRLNTQHTYIYTHTHTHTQWGAPRAPSG